MATIGKNYEIALRDVQNNNINSEYYVAPASQSMDCTTLQANFNALQDQIELWSQRINALKFTLFSGDKKEAENIGKIIEIQGNKLTAYAEILQANCGSVADNTGDTGPQSQEPKKTGGVNPLLIIGGAGLLAFALAKRKRKT